MAQPLRQLTIQAPAFFGVNTQDSPVGIDPNFATVAENAVIDKQGRIASRKGLSSLTNDATKTVNTIFETVSVSGATQVFATGDNKIYKGESLTEVTLPTGYTITDNNWKIVSLQSNTYFYQRGHNPLVYTTGNVLVDITVGDGGSIVGDTTAPQANEVLSAFGRLWAADTSTNKTTIFFSDTLRGHDANSWTPQDGTGTDDDGNTIDANLAGSLDISLNLPNGTDEIVALHAHNGFLIIFCKKNILIYGNPESPTSLQLTDTIEGVGCIARDSVQNIGTDVLFLSDTGVRSLGRTIQEKSLPMRDVSKNIRNDLVRAVGQETQPIKSAYSPDEAFYLLTFPTNKTVFCFDIRQPLPDNAFRVTTWTEMEPLCFEVKRDKSLLIGKLGGVYKYTGFTDKSVVSGLYTSSSYQLRYFSTPMNFGNSSNLKFLKKFKITVVGNNSSETVLNWGYDYTTSFNRQLIVNENTESNEGIFNVSEFGQVGVDFTQDTSGNTVTGPSAEYSRGIELQFPTVNGSGSGTTLTVGLESTINGTSYSIQQIDINVLLGRTI